jgi:hypothetical protein
MPAAAVAFVANSPALGAVFNDGANQGMTVNDNKGVSTNGPSTNGVGSNTNGDRGELPMAGIRG